MWELCRYGLTLLTYSYPTEELAIGLHNNYSNVKYLSTLSVLNFLNVGFLPHFWVTSKRITANHRGDQRKNVVICFSKRFCHWHCTYSEISQKMTAGNWLFSAKELSWVNKILFWTIWSVAWSCFKELLSFHSMFQMQLPRQILRLFKRCILCFLFWPKT